MKNSVKKSSAPSLRLRAVQTYADRFLKTLKRGSGESYNMHGKEVSKVLSEVAADESILAIAMLHDILVHPDGPALLQKSPLTEDEKSIVRRMHKLRRLHIDANTDDLDLVIDSFVEDPRLMLLRMAHRLNDIRHLDRFSTKRRRELAHETLHMYSAISGRLGFQRWRWQMEDICFLALQPKIAGAIQKEFDACKKIDSMCLKHTTAFLQKTFEQHGLKPIIDERIKGLYSTYRKMVLKKKRFDELTDRLALRILVPTQDDCYRALGILHGAMHAIPGKLKDYIGTPKENGYRSIHTVVFPLPGVSVLPLEIQIRTPQMHQDCEYGIASHTSYKDLTYALTSQSARSNLFRNLEHLRSLSKTPAQFEKALRTSFRQDEIIVFDPENTLYHMRHPVTPLDFACDSLQIDPLTVNGAKVNGRKQPLSMLLRDGDTVEIITGKTPLTQSEYLKASQQAQTKKIVKTRFAAKKK